MRSRQYQIDLQQKIEQQWIDGFKNVLAVLPMGGGKTHIIANILKKHKGASCVIAHRQELVIQISTALNRQSISHRIIGPTNVIKLAVSNHMVDKGVSHYDPMASCAVAGVNTLIRRKDKYQQWCNSVTKWVIDEAHHILKSNMWGKATALFPHAVGLGVTATPCRTDGKGLGGDSDGVFDTLVVGPPMRDLINMGYLVDYKIIAPPPALLMANVDMGNNGEYKHNKVISKFNDNKSKIIGDVVHHYLKFARGKLGVTFVPSIEQGLETAQAYNAGGVAAAVISSKTSDRDRIELQRDFKNRKLLQLVNVDILGEGVDIPAIEVVSMVRPTASFGLYSQEFGRMLRLFDGKKHGLLIDHVGNVHHHGLPDAPQNWSLSPREKRSKGKPSDAIPTRTCLNDLCLTVYERIYKACPYCGHIPEIAIRSGPEFVDGDLTELNDATLAAMRGDITDVELDASLHREKLIKKHVPYIGVLAQSKKHIERQQVLIELRSVMDQWSGYQRVKGRDMSESYKRFYFKFSIDVLSAQVLKLKDMRILLDKIKKATHDEHNHYTNHVRS